MITHNTNSMEQSLSKLIVAHLFKKSPAFVETQCLLSCPQEPATGSNLIQKNPVLTCFFRIHFCVILSSTPRSPNWSLPIMGLSR